MNKITINVPVVYMARDIIHNDFDAGKIHFEGNWKGWALKISVADPGCLSRIRDPNFFRPRSLIHITEFKYFNPKKWFLSSIKYDPDCSSRNPDDFLPIPDPGSRAPDPGSEYATLLKSKTILGPGMARVMDLPTSKSLSPSAK
jgi:hypothetical protein